MALNSTETAATELDDAKETPSETKTLDQVIAESRDNILAGSDRRSGPGRRPKYHSEEARRAARNEQNRAYKAKKNSGQGESSTGNENAPTSSPVREVHPEPQPAGLAPLLDPLADVPIFRLRATYALTAEEFPGIDPEAKKMLVAQADLTIGVFCPNAANNKWVLLGSLVATATLIYAGAASQAEDVFMQKKLRAEAAEMRNPTTQSLSTPVFTASM